MNSWKTLVLLVVIAPCSLLSQPRQTAKSLNAVFDRTALYAQSWNLIELNGTTIEYNGSRYAYISFAQDDYNRIYGFTGCNSMGGRAVPAGADGIKFFPDITSTHNCAGGTVESPLIATLLEVDKWAEKNGQLFLYKKGKTVARFIPSNYTNANLYGKWQLQYIKDPTISFDELYPTTCRPSMTFAADKNVVSGYTGCNEFSFPVTVNNNTIVFSDGTPGDITCEGTSEEVFYNSLKNINNYVVKNDNNLVLAYDDRPVMLFTRTKSK